MWDYVAESTDTYGHTFPVSTFFFMVNFVNLNWCLVKNSLIVWLVFPCPLFWLHPLTRCTQIPTLQHRLSPHINLLWFMEKIRNKNVVITGLYFCLFVSVFLFFCLSNSHCDTET